MGRKAKIVASMLALAVLVSGLVIWGTASAQEEPTPTPTPAPTPTPHIEAHGPLPTLWSKVAVILGIDEQQLVDATKQAQEEISAEALDSWLDKAVEGGGVITQEQAEDIRSWWSQRSGLLPQGLAPHRFGRFLGGMMQSKDASPKALIAKVAVILGIDEQQLVDAIKQAQEEISAEALDRRLDKAVEEGVITQEQADQIREWWGQRPDFLPQGSLLRGFGRFSRDMRGTMHGGMTHGGMMDGGMTHGGMMDGGMMRGWGMGQMSPRFH